MKILIVVFLLKCFSLSLFSQNGDHVGGGVFSKNIEYNIRWFENGYNLDSKKDVEKLFFGDFNAPIEFLYTPHSEGASGFRVVKDSLEKTYILETKSISNFQEARNAAFSMYPTRSISMNEMVSLSKDTIDQIATQNQDNIKKAFEEMNKNYNTKSDSFRISDQFAIKLYEKMVSIIDNFKARGAPPLIDDGYSVTFRNVVEDEVWSLKIHLPRGVVLNLADICRQIIKDADDNRLNEMNYIKLLDDL
jgi:hypothetical protein